MFKFYVYRHIRLDTNTPFYVGKGTQYRAYKKIGRNLFWNNIVNKADYKIEILKHFENEEDAFIFEKILIKAYKGFGYCKANMTDGGEGASGKVTSEKTKCKMRLAHRKRDCKHPEARRLKMSESSIGKTMSQQAKLRMSKSKTGMHIGNANGMFKYNCKVNEVMYSCVKELSDILQVDRRVVDYRCRSKIDKWKNWEFINE